MEELKRQVLSAGCLSRWERGRKTRVTTDASNIGVGAVLEQEYEEGWRPVAFWSRRLKDAEMRYATTDKEWLAIVEAVSRKWRHYLEDVPFVVC